jgi:thiaminase
VRAAVEALREELRPVEERLRRHPYLAAVEDGRVGEAGLRVFAAEQHAIISSDRRSFQLLASRFPAEPAGSFFVDMAGGEEQALELLLAFERDLGLADPDAHEPLAGCHAYPAFVAWLGLNGSPADVALAFLVNLAAWGESCARMAAALRGRYDVAFFEFFASAPPGFEERCLEVVGAGDDFTHASRAARLLQAYELLYWDTLADGL